jgi:hypothetical protein
MTQNNKLIDAINISDNLTLNATEIRAIINSSPIDELKELLLKSIIN